MGDQTRHTVDPKFVIPRQGKQMVLYAGLLDAAHRAGLVNMTTEIVQYPHKENDNTCIVRAEVSMTPDAGGRFQTFTGIGDANPRNVGANIAPHFIRMAETRAKARALRDALNIGMVTVEELGADDDDHQPPPARPARDSASPVPRPTDRAAAAGEAAAPPLTAEEFEGVLDRAWKQAEDGKPLIKIRDALNAARHNMSKEQRALVLVELQKITERFYPATVPEPPASIAG